MNPMFPRERLKQEAIESPVGPGPIYHESRGYPVIGNRFDPVPWCVLEDGFVYDPFDVRGSTPKDGEPLDIMRRARSLVTLLRGFGHEDITHPDASAECEDEWGPDYAIICDAFTPYGDAVDSSYFDEGECLVDFKKLVRDHFACDPTVDVTYHNVPWGSNEIEVTRNGR